MHLSLSELLQGAFIGFLSGPRSNLLSRLLEENETRLHHRSIRCKGVIREAYHSLEAHTLPVPVPYVPHVYICQDSVWEYNPKPAPGTEKLETTFETKDFQRHRFLPPCEFEFSKHPPSF